ncbi:MAG: ACT domain-containing protein, partial [Acidimicrobiales bacterium]
GACTTGAAEPPSTVSAAGVSSPPGSSPPRSSAVVPDTSQAKVTIGGVPDEPGVAAALFRALAEEMINVDMIVQNVSDNGETDISFTVPSEQLPTARDITQRLATEIGAGGVTTDETIGRVSVVGAGMASNPGVAATMFETLSNNGINIGMISTSAIRISCVVEGTRVDEATIALHHAFELDVG